MSKRKTAWRGVQRDHHAVCCPNCGVSDPDVFTLMCLDDLVAHADIAGQPFDLGHALAESMARGPFEVDGSSVWWWCHNCWNGGAVVRS